MASHQDDERDRVESYALRLRQIVSKGAGSRTKGPTMTFKLLDMAETRWRKLNAPESLPLVFAAVRSKDGIQEKKDRKAAA